jgi:hypothetical protein
MTSSQKKVSGNLPASSQQLARCHAATLRLRHCAACFVSGNNRRAAIVLNVELIIQNYVDSITRHNNHSSTSA